MLPPRLQLTSRLKERRYGRDLTVIDSAEREINR